MSRPAATSTGRPRGSELVVSRSSELQPGGRRRTAGKRGGDQTAAAKEGMLGGMREPQAGRTDRAGPTGTLRVTAMQRDDQTLAGPPGQ